MSAKWGVWALGLLFAVAPAFASVEQPAGWSVHVKREAALAKTGDFMIQVSVRDNGGFPVNDARVFVKMPGSGSPESRMVPLHWSGHGHYRRTVSLRGEVGEASDLPIIVEP